MKYISERRINRNNNNGDDELDRMKNYVQSVANSYNTGINKRNNHMKNQGYVDVKNHTDCIRILSLNLRGFGPDNVKKVETMLQSIQQYEIEGILLSSPDRKWRIVDQT